MDIAFSIMCGLFWQMSDNAVRNEHFKTPMIFRALATMCAVLALT